MVRDLRQFEPVPNLSFLNKYIFEVIWMKYPNYNINSKADRTAKKGGSNYKPCASGYVSPFGAPTIKRRKSRKSRR